MPKLSGKYELFCQQYVIDYNGTQAAIRTGYSENSARQQSSRLLAMPEILTRIRELQAEQVERLAISQDYVMLELLDSYKCCRAPSPVLRYDPATGEMEETGVYQFDSKGALRALELIGKHLGMYQKAAPTGQTGCGNLLERLVDGTGEDMNTDDLPEVK